MDWRDCVRRHHCRTFTFEKPKGESVAPHPVWFRHHPKTPRWDHQAHHCVDTIAVRVTARLHLMATARNWISCAWVSRHWRQLQLASDPLPNPRLPSGRWRCPWTVRWLLPDTNPVRCVWLVNLRSAPLRSTSRRFVRSILASLRLLDRNSFQLLTPVFSSARWSGSATGGLALVDVSTVDPSPPRPQSEGLSCI